jgi:maltose alpha-D-glucosyltransferase/alpha-amylase
LLCEATWDKDFWHELLATVAGKRKLTGRQGMLTGVRTSAFPDLWDNAVLEMIPSVHGGEQSNTSAVFVERFILKLFRRLTPGINPDFEIGRKLTEHSDFANAPQVAGSLEYRDDMNRQYTVAILHQYIPNVGDAWTYTLDELSRYLERVQSTTPETALLETAAAACPLPTAAATVTMAGTPLPAAPPAHAELTFPRSLQELMETEPHQLAQDTIGAYLHSAALLGRRTAQLHVALANLDDDPAFTPEPFTRLYQRSLYQSMRSQARTTIELLRSQQPGLAQQAREQAARVIEGERTIFARFAELLHDRIDARRTRLHADLHLGQVLFTGKDFMIIDFEGEPERPVSERRIKASPLRDVAGMMRSFHYASHAALRGHAPAFVVENTAIPIETWVTFWYSWCSASFVQAYVAEAQPGRFLPADKAQLRTLLYIYLLEKALYELRYELNNRPDWVAIPLEGIMQLLP